MKYKLNTRAEVVVNQMKLECIYQFAQMLLVLKIVDSDDRMYKEIKRHFKVRI